MQKASGGSVHDGNAALRLLHRDEIQAVALGRPGGARGETGTSETRVVRAAMHLRPFCITLLVSCAVNNWHMSCIGFRYLQEWRCRHADGTSES
jgi:hypothetical protein